jgi:NADPH-dependent curcumin reductase
MTAFDPAMNRQWRLARRPVGDISDGDLELRIDPRPTPGPGEVLLRTLYLSLDPTNRIWMSDQVQYMPPVEIGAVMRGGNLAVVEQSNDPALPVGALCMGTLDGWQDYQVAPAGMVRMLPRIPGFPVTGWLSVAGLTGVTAWFGIMDIGKPRPGETVVISAAAGGVGSIAGQIAKIEGARVVGIAGGPEKCRRVVEEYGFDACIDYKTEDVGARLDALCPDGIDVNFENVGGAIMDAVMARMNNFSRMALCGMISSYNDTGAPQGPAMFPRILMRRITVRGFIVSDYLGQWAEAAGKLAGLAMEGKIRFRDHVVDGLENAPNTVKMLFSGANDGKLLVRVSPDPG